MSCQGGDEVSMKEKQLPSTLIKSHHFGATSDCHKLILSDCRVTQ